MKKAIAYYCEMYLDGVDSTTISQTVSALFGINGKDLADVADAGVKTAKSYYANLRAMNYA